MIPYKNILNKQEDINDYEATFERSEDKQNSDCEENKQS
jgi:hypothetical protein